MQHVRQLVDGRLDVHFLDHGFHGDVAEKTELFPDLLSDRLLGSADQHVRLNSDFAQLCHALLSGLRLEFPSGPQARHKCDVQKENVGFADFQGKLPQCLDERQSFDIAYGAPNFRDEHVDSLAGQMKPFLDLVCYVRDNLYRFPQVVAPSLLLDYGFVDLT